jgi:hypothetical protein
VGTAEYLLGPQEQKSPADILRIHARRTASQPAKDFLALAQREREERTPPGWLEQSPHDATPDNEWRNAKTSVDSFCSLIF